ncbi:MAG: glycosyltransferase family 1 protein [Geodermatophilaceae bacterium]|nr:glycosyltransferase family 1 protein [Geodermatophilaceae bacterium]
MASIPADHVYVRHLSRPSCGAGQSGRDDPVHRLADPTRPWWPPAMLDADWVHDHADSFDAFHIHFGFDACAPSALENLVTALRAHGKPLVQTVHDLRNPHHETRAAHDEHLDILIPAADALITLTPGAAAEIERRWGRTARVIPHPHVLDLVELERRERRTRTPVALARGQPPRPFQVGVHLKSMRPCMSGQPVLAALMDVVEQMGDAVLRVDVHRDVAEHDGERHDPVLVEALREVAARGAQIEVHDFFSDAQLWDYLAGLDLSVLPYRYGTHSGWLEACRDLGTVVVAPTCGYYAEQWPVHSFELDESGLDEISLARAVWAGRCAGKPMPLTAGARRAQRSQIAAAHEEIYRDVLR